MEKFAENAGISVVKRHLWRLTDENDLEMTERESEFTKLVRENKSTIYAVCYMFSTNRDEVSDLFQNILLNIWTGLDTFRNESKKKTWIYRVALNVCISADRKKKRSAETVPLSIDIDPYEDINENALQVQQLYRRISRLGFVDRSLVLLWLEALSYEEIGEIMGISAKNVSVKLTRIKEQLKNMKDGNR